MGVARNVVNADLLRGRRREVWLRGGKAMGSEGEGGDTSQESGCHRALGEAGSRDPPPWKLQQEPDPPTPQPWPGETGLQPEREELCVSSHRVGGRV